MTLKLPMVAGTVALSLFCAGDTVWAKEKEFAWGAIAIDAQKPDRDPAYGIGGGDDENEAKTNALKFCKESGGKECKPIVAYQECGAYAASQRGGGWGINTTKKTAEAKAMSGCDDDSCKVVVSDCN